MVVQLRLVLEINKRQTKGHGLNKEDFLIRHKQFILWTTNNRTITW